MEDVGAKTGVENFKNPTISLRSVKLFESLILESVGSVKYMGKGALRATEMSYPVRCPEFESLSRISSWSRDA